MEVLLTDKADYPIFMIEYPKETDKSIFNIYRVVYHDSIKKLISQVQYATGFIREDGMIRIRFGDDNNIGTIHLHGKEGLEIHKKLLDKIWEVVTSKIEGFRY